MTEIRAGAVTDVGRTRNINQDTPLVADDLGLWAVADGMGGHKGGEVASAVAIETLQRMFRDVDPTVDALLDAAASANTAVYDAAGENPDLKGMGTTLVAIARTSADDLAYVNVGDSRIYLLRDGELDRLTSDHSLVEELVRDGQITPEEAKVHPRRNIVTRALGIEPWVKIDSNTITPYVGDRFVLCSDGLFGEVDEDRIGSVLRRLADPQEAAAELVRLANEAGGRDNITVVVVDVVDDGGRAQAASKVVESGSPDLAGFSSAIDPADDGPAHAAKPARAPKPPREKGPRRVTARVVLFLVLLLAILGGGALAIAQYASGTYYVTAEEDGSVVIFKGKPGGVLWIDPSLEERTEFVLDDLEPAARGRIRAGVEFGSLEEARDYVQGITTTTTSTTTSTTRPTTTTTTTVPPPTTSPAP
jgi:protein phosphatase